MEGKPNMLLYFVPANSWNIEKKLPIAEIKGKLKPICGFNTDALNGDYLITFGQLLEDSTPMCVTQLKENGIISAGDSSLFKENTFSMENLEKRIKSAVYEYLTILIDDLNVKMPIYFIFSVDGIKGFKEIDNEINYKENGFERQFTIRNGKEDVDIILRRIIENLFDGLKFQTI